MTIVYVCAQKNAFACACACVIYTQMVAGSCLFTCSYGATATQKKSLPCNGLSFFCKQTWRIIALYQKSCVSIFLNFQFALHFRYLSFQFGDLCFCCWVAEVTAWVMAALPPASKREVISESSTGCAIADAFGLFRWEV